MRFFDIWTSIKTQNRQFSTLLTSKCAWRHNGVHFFDIWTSKSGPNPSVFSTLTWKCASRHNGVQFFISHLASWLRTRRFSEPTFRPPRATNHWKKHSESRLSYLFAHLHLLSSLIFSLPFFSSLTLPILSEVSLLNFLRWYIYFYVYIALYIIGAYVIYIYICIQIWGFP